MIMTALHTASDIHTLSSSHVELKHPNEKEQQPNYEKSEQRQMTRQSFSLTNSRVYHSCVFILSYTHMNSSLAFHSLSLSRSLKDDKNISQHQHRCNTVAYTQPAGRHISHTHSHAWYPCTHDGGVMHEVWPKESQLVHRALFNRIWNTTNTKQSQKKQLPLHGIFISHSTVVCLTSNRKRQWFSFWFIF